MTTPSLLLLLHKVPLLGGAGFVGGSYSLRSLDVRGPAALTAEMGRVWTAPGWQAISSRVQQWSEQYGRPVSAVNLQLLNYYSYINVLRQ